MNFMTKLICISLLRILFLGRACTPLTQLRRRCYNANSLGNFPPRAGSHRHKLQKYICATENHVFLCTTAFVAWLAALRSLEPFVGSTLDVILQCLVTRFRFGIT
jgi:hypothetical protein